MSSACSTTASACTPTSSTTGCPIRRTSWVCMHPMPSLLPGLTALVFVNAPLATGASASALMHAHALCIRARAHASITRAHTRLLPLTPTADKCGAAPSITPERVQNELKDYCIAAVKALGFKHGDFHMEVRVFFFFCLRRLHLRTCVRACLCARPDVFAIASRCAAWGKARVPPHIGIFLGNNACGNAMLLQNRLLTLFAPT